MGYFGGHISISKGDLMDKIKAVMSHGANVLQFFAYTPYRASIASKQLDYYEKNGKEIRSLVKSKDLKLFLHSPYILNIAKPMQGDDKDYIVDNMIKELYVSDLVSAVGCVLHMGKATKQAVSDAENNMHEQILAILAKMEETGIKSKLFIETSAGQGTELYVTDKQSLDNLARFYNRFTKAQKKRVGICVDTCHIFAAGYDISKPEQVIGFFDEFEKKIGLEHLGVVHLNNSTRELGCRVDRHACLQYGKIAYDGITTFAMMCYQHGIPVLLETPGVNEEIALLKGIYKDWKSAAMQRSYA